MSTQSLLVTAKWPIHSTATAALPCPTTTTGEKAILFSSKKDSAMAMFHAGHSALFIGPNGLANGGIRSKLFQYWTVLVLCLFQQNQDFYQIPLGIPTIPCHRIHNLRSADPRQYQLESHPPLDLPNACCERSRKVANA